jgi:hypothetical protein
MASAIERVLAEGFKGDDLSVSIMLLYLMLQLDLNLLSAISPFPITHSLFSYGKVNKLLRDKMNR